MDNIVCAATAYPAGRATPCDLLYVSMQQCWLMAMMLTASAWQNKLIMNFSRPAHPSLLPPPPSGHGCAGA